MTIIISHLVSQTNKDTNILVCTKNINLTITMYKLYLNNPRGLQIKFSKPQETKIGQRCNRSCDHDNRLKLPMLQLMRTTIARSRVEKNTCVVQNMEEKTKLVKKGFQLFQIINRYLRPTIPKEPPWLPKVTTRDHLIYQELQAVNLHKENESINSCNLHPNYMHIPCTYVHLKRVLSIICTFVHQKRILCEKGYI